MTASLNRHFRLQASGSRFARRISTISADQQHRQDHQTLAGFLMKARDCTPMALGVAILDNGCLIEAQLRVSLTGLDRVCVSRRRRPIQRKISAGTSFTSEQTAPSTSSTGQIGPRPSPFA